MATKSKVVANETNESVLANALNQFNAAAHAPLTKELGKALAVGAGAALGFMAVTAIHTAIAS
jgi:hypothetical protein